MATTGKISDRIPGFDKLKTRREKLNAVMNYEHTKGMLKPKSKALHKETKKEFKATNKWAEENIPY